MTQYNPSNVKLFDSQLSKSKSGIKNATQVTINLLSNVVAESNDEINFPHNLYELIHNFERFIKLLQMVYQLR